MIAEVKRNYTRLTSHKVHPDLKENPEQIFFDTQREQILRLLKRVESYEAQINVLAKRAARDVVEIGMRLIQVKSRMACHEFGRFCKALGLSKNTVYYYRKVGERFGYLIENDLNIIQNFQASALMLLAQNCVPEEVVESAINLCIQGKTVTYTMAQELVAEAKETSSSTKTRIPPALKKRFEEAYLQLGQEKLMEVLSDALSSRA